MATTIVSESAANFAERDLRAHGDELDGYPASEAMLGVRHGGVASWVKRGEVGFYALTKQGGALIALWWIATHPTGWIEWSGFALFYVLNVLAMNVCYHRYFVHRSFETSLPMRYLLGIWAQLGAYGSLKSWCADHRRHHSRSDRPGDAHSPYFDNYGRPLSGARGLRHAHLGWLFDDSTTDPAIYGKGLADDRVIAFCHRTRFAWYAISVLLLPAAWGFVLGGPAAITGTILIAGFLRMALSLHAIALVNSVGHRYGSQRFEGTGSARNNLFVAIVSLGEGWHNNHHAHPRSANHGMARHEIDVASW